VSFQNHIFFLAAVQALQPLPLYCAKSAAVAISTDILLELSVDVFIHFDKRALSIPEIDLDLMESAILCR
jgi:hypothetical protein